MFSKETGLDKILREHQFDWSFERLSYSDHNISSKDPKNVIEEKSNQEDAAITDFVQWKKFNTTASESNSKQIVCNPMLEYIREKTRKSLKNLLIIV